MEIRSATPADAPAILAVTHAAFAQATRFEIFTGHASEHSLALYSKLGYRPLRTEPLNERLSLVFLEKRPPASRISAPHPPRG